MHRRRRAACLSPLPLPSPGLPRRGSSRPPARIPRLPLPHRRPLCPRCCGHTSGCCRARGWSLRATHASTASCCAWAWTGRSPTGGGGSTAKSAATAGGWAGTLLQACSTCWPPLQGGKKTLATPAPSRRVPCRRYSAPPVQQQTLMNVLLRCRMGSSLADQENCCDVSAIGGWAQHLVQASRPASATAAAQPWQPWHGGQPWQPSRAGPELDEPGAAAHAHGGVAGLDGILHCNQPLGPQGEQPSAAGAASAAAAVAPAAAGWDQLESASFMSLPPGTAAEAQQQEGAAQLEAALLAWQRHAGCAAAPSPAAAEASSEAQPGLQAAAQAWRQGSAAAGPGLPGRARAFKGSASPPVEDAVVGWQQATGPWRPASAGAASSVAMCVVVPPPLVPHEHVQHGWAAAGSPTPAASIWGSPPLRVIGVPACPAPGQHSPQPDHHEQNASPISRPQPVPHSAKYPPIYCTPAAAGPSHTGASDSPRILAYLQPSAAPPATAPVVAAPAQAPPLMSPGVEQQVLRCMWGEWRVLARSAAAAQRVAELRGGSRAEDFRQEQLLRHWFRAWCIHKQAVAAAVMGRMAGSALRRTFFTWRQAAGQAAELGRRACLHYNRSSLRAILKVMQSGVEGNGQGQRSPAHPRLGNKMPQARALAAQPACCPACRCGGWLPPTGEQRASSAWQLWPTGRGTRQAHGS